jgi:XrtN system VIT domain protein
MDTPLEPQVKPADVRPLTATKKEITIAVGYVFLATSFFLFCLFEWIDPKEETELFTIFIGHYLLALAYAGVLIYHKGYGVQKSWRRQNISKTIILLNLFLISAYALNRELPVFEESVNWLCGFLVITSITLLSYHYFDQLPKWVNRFQHFILGSALVLYLYMTLFVAEYYPVGLIGLIFFGIGGHIFVPLTLILGALSLVVHFRKRISVGWIVAGFSVTAFYALAFVIEWKSRVSKLETLTNQSPLYGEPELPLWVTISQSVSNDWITQRILKSDLVYTTPRGSRGFRFMPNTLSWDEERKHDPFVFLALMVKRPTLSTEDRIKVLQTISDSRHRGNERLWSGDNLTTSYIISDIDIYPDLRLAYTEKYLNVRNNAEQGWWGNTEEAIYTFQLPEGSVITSLSLWVNGKEEKGILTSKQKAAKAYKTIVGVEKRDPSVVHWQEGNTVTVRVFPCTTNEERKFKIGITSPLAERDGSILYKNVTFKGPAADDARETIRFRFMGDASFNVPHGFVKDKNGDFVLENKYDPDFDIAFKKVPVKANNHFSFDGFDYSIKSYEPVFKHFEATTIYLDINKSWTDLELNAFHSLLSDKKVIVFHDERFQTLNEESWEITEELKQRNFSLFPFHHIKDVEHALVVTKGQVLTPHLSDFKESTFAKGIAQFFTTGNKIRVYNLSGQISNYISSLRELRALEFAQGDQKKLLQLLKEKRYPAVEESENKIVLHDANMVIYKQRSEKTQLSNAPDHLMRLHAYNNIMRKIGAEYFKKDHINDQLVDEAATAYVVSPVSSLIVLETQEDYKRFDIADKENSLHNASKQSSGAVPEPHEWALIILFLLFVAYVSVRKRRPAVNI